MKRFIVALTLVLSVILPSVSVTPSTDIAKVVSPTYEKLSAHAADCPIYVSPLVHYSGSRLLEGFSRINCHQARYKLTTYICGGINGNGYCAWGRSNDCPGGNGCTSLTATTSCSTVYNGAYWHYGGAKIQNYNLIGQTSTAYWFFGPGQWVQGGCG